MLYAGRNDLSLAFEQAPNILREGRRGDVEILHRPIEERIANGPSDHEGLVAALVENGERFRDGPADEPIGLQHFLSLSASPSRMRAVAPQM